MDSYPHEGLETHPTATVLVVDDEPAIREVIAALLGDRGLPGSARQRRFGHSTQSTVVRST